ncbi:uncharacterized protein LOC100250700 isoform X2 [Vitis vinifera]|uniref:uncharacterized protein LOC100250700 isoform X2 n=1 Tax=Vitis vinifera TaxID=29760 RepID=UPI0001BE40B2|eukprot:XP_019080426.1 PREDICTED: uncharacterized protein LOC100250700 isoform X2 [Vitis vinifera]
MSKPQVTITLGRTGQKVVKRGGAISDDVDDDRKMSGSKRSIRDRLGSNVDSSSLSMSKRHRGDEGTRSADFHAGPNDLRFTLMRKKQSRQTRGDVEVHERMDLRENLSRTVRPAANNKMMQQRSEPNGSSLLRRTPRVGSADDLLQVDSLGRSYSSWSRDGFRSRSPERIFKSSRGLSPPRNIDKLRSTGSAPLTMKATLETTKAATRLPLAGGAMPKNSYMGNEPVNVSSLLHSLGLEKYVINFQAEEVDMTALKQMGDNDLKEMGIPMGPRKKILLALLSRSRRQPP